MRPTWRVRTLAASQKGGVEEKLARPAGLEPTTFRSAT
jgi:hypothetical protein